MSDQPNPNVNWKHRAQRYYKSAQAGVRNAYSAYKKGYDKAKDYLKKPKNVIQLLTLIFVGVYTVVSCEQLNVASDQEHRQLRAYIGPVFESFRISNGPNAEGVFTSFPSVVEYKLKNYGTTPAEQPVSCVGVVILKTESLDERIEEGNAECKRRGRIKTILPTIWPNEERKNISGVESPALAVNAMLNNRAFFLADIEYADIFNQIHHTYICRRVYMIFGIAAFANCKTWAEKQDD